MNPDSDLLKITALIAAGLIVQIGAFDIMSMRYALMCAQQDLIMGLQI